MSSPEELYIHCEGFEVELHLSPQKGLSPLERLVLEAIHAGMSDFKGLSELFVLSERPTLDLLLELWQRDYVRIDTETGQLELTEAVKANVERGDYQGLTGGIISNHKLELFVERISGHILPTVPWGEGLRKGRVVAPVLPDGSWRKASRAELTAAIRYRFEHTKQHLSNQHLVDFSLPPPGVDGDAPGRNRFLRLEVRCRRGANDFLQIEVLGPSEVPARLRQTLSVELTQLASRRRQEPVFKNLLQKLSDEEDFTHVSLTRAVEDLEAELERLSATSEPHQAAERQQRLELRGEQLRSLLAERLAQQGQTSLVKSEDQLEWIRAALQSAHSQVVLAFPQIRYEQLSGLLPVLREALGRGVYVAVLWGAQRDEQLETTVRGAFEELSRSHSGFQWALLSARLNGRLVAVDGCRLLSSSFPVLSHRGGRRLELGWSFERPTERPVPASLAEAVLANPCLAALALARDRMPDYREAQKLRTYPDELLPPGTNSPEHSADSEEGAAMNARDELLPELPSLPECLQPPRESDEDEDRRSKTREAPDSVQWDPDFQRAELRLWKDAWQHTFAAFNTLRGQIGAGASLLQDSDHLLQLWLRLNQAERFLIVASPRLTRAAVSPRFVRKVQERLEQGLVLILVHERPLEAGLETSFEAFIRAYPERFRLFQHDHALNLLLDEQEATLTSFPLLSFDELAMETGRSRGEVGLRVRDAQFSIQVLGWLQEQMPELRSVVALRGDPPPPVTSVPAVGLQAVGSAADVTTPASPALRVLLSRLGKRTAEDSNADAVLTASQLAAIEQWADAGLSLERWERDLEILGSLEIPDPARARILAAGLEARWEARAEPAAQRALRWLIGWLWHEHGLHPSWRHPQAFPVALLLEELALEEDLEALPTLPLVLLLSHTDPARRCSAGDLERAWADADAALRAHPRTGEAATVLACAAVLEGLDAGARAWLESPPGPMPEELARVVALLKDLEHRTKLEANLEQVTRAHALEESERAWNEARAALLEALERARNVRFYYTFGSRVWQHIHRKGSALSKMCEFASENHVDRLHILIRELRAGHVTPMSIIRSACVELDPYVNSRSGEIDGDKLEPCLKRLAEVFSMAEEWITADTRRTQARQRAIWSQQARQHVDRLKTVASGLERLEKEWKAARHPGHPLLRALRDILQNLTRAEGDRR